MINTALDELDKADMAMKQHIIRFHVEGVPVPKQSFKVSGKGGYTPERQASWQELIAYKAAEVAKQKDFPPAMKKERVCVAMSFYLPDHRRRDLDNLSKAVLDACNGILWQDDTQVDHLTLDKHIGEKPGVNFTAAYWDNQS